MHPLVWCGVGGVAGAIAIAVLSTQGTVARIENLLVGVFGAFVGGDLLAPAAKGGADGAAAVWFGIGGAVVLLVLLALMRRKVGALLPHKKRRRP